ncbi:chaperone NapD [Roseateles sp. BYS96W]|uniref:Chaperone NapD n=1 Tax=Pelomonas nitida TaxID=3299027 RepID=A0ABW7GCT5_9BURK
MTDELHITSLVVHALPERCAQVRDVITTLADAQIHGTDANGKFVVTLEAPTSGAILDQVSQLQQTPGVIGVAMVYQHVEPLESLNTEIPHVDHTT